MKSALAEKNCDLSRSDPANRRGFSGHALDIGLGVLIAAVPLMYSPLAPNSLKWAILGLLTSLLTGLWLWAGSFVPFRPLPTLVAPLLALILVSQLSLLQAMNLYYGLQQVTHLLVLFLLYLIVAQTCSRSDQQARLVRYQLLTLLGVSILSLFGCTMPGVHAVHSAAETLFRLFGNTNYGAAYLLTVIPLSLALYLRASERWERGLWGTTLRAPVLALGLSFLFGVLFTALLWGLMGFEAPWSTIGTRFPLRPEASPQVAPVASGLTLPVLQPDPAFPYSVWALPSQEGEPLRPSLLVGRFKTREEAEDALKRMQTLEGLRRLEVVETGNPVRQEQR